MNRRIPLALTAVAALFALVATPALASRPPAINIYVEQVPTASGPKSLGSGATTTPNQSVPLSPTAATTLQREGGKDRTLLRTLATSRELGAQGRLTAAAPTSEQSPNALGATFGIGSGPTALFVVLIVGAILGFAAGRFRGRRS